MKRLLGPAVTLILVASIHAVAPAQIPNPGFETWAGTGVNELPAGWITSNIPGFAVPVTKTTTAHSGSFALKGDVVDVMGLGLYPPYFWAHFPYSQRPGSLTGYYTFTSVAGDSLDLFVVLYKQSLSIVVASGEIGLTANTTSFGKFTIPLEYFSDLAPDSAWFEVTIQNGQNDTLHMGTGYSIDDLAFEGSATGVAEAPMTPATFSLEQNYPNPFNPETVIRYDVPVDSDVRLSVYNPLGQSVMDLVHEQQAAGSYQVKMNGSTLPSGVYFYRLEATRLSAGSTPDQERNGRQGFGGGSFSQTRKLVLLR